MNLRHKGLFILVLFVTIVNQSIQYSFDRPHPYLPISLHQIKTKDLIEEDLERTEIATALKRATEILQEIIDHANMLEGMKR